MILLYEFLYVKHQKLKIHDCRFYNDTSKIENTRVPVMVRFFHPYPVHFITGHQYILC